MPTAVNKESVFCDIYDHMWKMRRGTVQSDAEAHVTASVLMALPIFLMLEVLSGLLAVILGTPTLYEMAGNKLLYIIMYGAIVFLMYRIFAKKLPNRHIEFAERIRMESRRAKLRRYTSILIYFLGPIGLFGYYLAQRT